mgnify:CR=1 FL=1|jgi:hypothetical protein
MKDKLKIIAAFITAFVFSFIVATIAENRDKPYPNSIMESEYSFTIPKSTPDVECIITRFNHPLTLYIEVGCYTPKNQ